MVGSAITRYLKKRGDELLQVDRDVVDLRDQLGVEGVPLSQCSVLMEIWL
jgi:hypothetical protein